MKRFLMYIVVAIVLISAGFSIYYVVRNNEEIYSLIEGDELFYINENETLEIPIVREHPASYTELTLKSGYEDYLDVDLENWTVTGKSAGIATLTFVSTNKRYEGETFDVHCHIGNGTVSHPYYIRNEQDILNLGKGQYKLSCSYEVVNDIKMTTSMMPIGVEVTDGTMKVNEFSGTITGGVHRKKISNVNVKIDGDLSPKSSGFFAVVGSNGKVENLVFENITVEGYHAYAGTIAGANFGLIGMCQVKGGKVINEYERGFTGGIVGLNERASGSDNFAQINICEANVELNSKWVAGGAAGKNNGGVIYNCLLKTNKLELSVADGQDPKYSYYGGVAGISVCGESKTGDIYDSYVANCLVYIDGIQPTTSHVAGVFGAYYGKSAVYESEGNYKMLMYVAPSNIKAYYLCDDEVEISDKNPSTAHSYAKRLTNEEALVKKTYTAPKGSNWDFTTVWSLIPSESISLAFDSADEENVMEYQTFASNGQTITITTKKELETAFNTMRAQPSKNYIYEITESIVYDGGAKEWEPIGSQTRPFKGQFKMNDDVTITIKNIKIKSEFAGLFGCISGNNTIIKNIILKDVEANGTVVGGIAACNYGATIENCQVHSYDFYTDKYLGSIAGYNEGTIKNCIVCSEPKTIEKEVNGEIVEEIVYDEETGEIVYTMSSNGGGMYINTTTTEPTIYIGGIVGKNAGTIDKVFLSKIELLQLAGENRELYLGGAAGVNTGKITDVKINNGFSVEANDYTTSNAYFGGLVGYHQSGSIISSAITGETDKVLSSFAFNKTNENIVGGGLAGYIGKGAKVYYSVADFVKMTGYSLGGFAGVCDGEIVQSYVSQNCQMDGAYVGGFTASLRGAIEDCMSAAEFNASKIEAGMTVYLRKDSRIDHCYIDVSFKQSANDASGKETFAETSSEFRARPDRFGSITNTIIVADTKTVTSVDKDGNETAHEELDFFKWGIKDTTLITNCYVNINDVKAKIQTYFLTFANDVQVAEYTSLNCTADGLLSKLGFLESNWNLVSEDSDASQMAIPLKAAEVVKVDIASKHKKDATDNSGSGEQENGNGGETTPPETPEIPVIPQPTASGYKRRAA